MQEPGEDALPGPSTATQFSFINGPEFNKMAKDDMVLGVDLEKLKIEPDKISKNVKEEQSLVSMQQRGFTCSSNYKSRQLSESEQNRCKNCAISKKKHKRILKEPVLKLLQNQTQGSNAKAEKKETYNLIGAYSSNVISDTLSLCTLVDNCNQLRISSGFNEQQLMNLKRSDENNWWKLSACSDKSSRDSIAGMSQTGSCSQQALNPPCDVTIDELASYFETLVHIPKKMSSMAEMMYI